MRSIEFTPIYEKPATQNITASIASDSSYAATNTSRAQIIPRTSWGADESLRVKSFQPDPDNSDQAESNAQESTISAEYKEFLETYKDEIVITKKVNYDENGNPLIWPLEYPEKIRKIFVHHTASTNNLDNPAQAVRDIYRWHAVSRGWGDVGYNYIIDQQGNIYEGRYGGETVVGGHVLRANTGSIGIAVLGNFQESDVPQAALDSLVKLIADKAELHSIDPNGATSFRGENISNISGHRDYGATACPGERLYAQLPSIRTQVAQSIGQGSKPVVTGNLYSYDVSSRPKDEIQVEKNKPFTFSLTLRNTGSQTWLQGGPSRVAISNQQGEIIGNLSQSSVKPGEFGIFYIKMRSPKIPGKQTIKVHPVRGKSNTAFDITRINIDLNIIADPYKGEIVGMTPDRVFRPGETKNIWLQVENQGFYEWYRDGNEAFTISHLASIDLKLLRKKLFQEIVRPGETGSALVTINAPQKEGDYTMYVYIWANGYKLTPNRVEIPIKVSTDPNATVPDPFNPVREDQPLPSLSTIQNTTEDQIRIALSFEGEPVITGNGPFGVYSNSSQIASFESGETAQVTKESNNYKITSGSETYISSAPPRFVPGLQTVLEIQNYEKRPAWNTDLNDNKFRGILEVYNDEGKLTVINELPLETYLRGIAEVSNSAEPEKIKALMVAARTYAKYYTTVDRKFPGKPYDLNDDPEVSQKYLGFGLEMRSPNVVSGVRQTEGEVVTYNGELVKTPYFNQSDGRTRSAQEVWGWTHTPYLQSVSDDYCEANQLLGHGVGLSGCGATGMAKAGKNYQEILKYFYQGVEITKK